MKQYMAVLGALLASAACGSSNATAPKGPTTYVANMSTANEVAPSVSGTATGTATFVLNGRTLTYTVTVTGLSSNATASHIHFGAAGVNGGVAYPFTITQTQNGQIASGTIDLNQPVVGFGTTISGDSLMVLFNTGGAYANVHTANNAMGEIRGQIAKQ
jgi:Cu/Zn superoxide dismutase